jgi:hypothetical protein
MGSVLPRLWRGLALRLVPVIPRLAAGVVCAAMAACAASPALRAANDGDYRALGQALAERQRAGNLPLGEAASIAQAVAGHEIRTAAPAEAADRVQDAAACARELDAALAERMRIHDAAGAGAALARIEGSGLDPASARSYAGDGDPSWRAVGTRGFVRPEDDPARLRALIDPEPLVRRAAARASRDAASAQDFAALAEAARKDPDPLVRTYAVRAIAVLPPLPAPSSGDTAANVLRDLWTAGDEGLREDIAIAWSSPTLWLMGGREALLDRVASEKGLGAIEAAGAILRRHAEDASVASLARAELARAVASGSRIARLAAIAETPVDRPELLAALKEAGAEEDERIRVAALARLALTGDAPAKGVLEGIGAVRSPSSRVASQARFALAAAGDRRVQAWIEQDLSAPAPEDRAGAASALAALGVASRAAPLLADGDARVRVRAACTILAASRVR